MKILITGAGGNVGTALLKRLADPASPAAELSGPVQIIGLARRPPALEPPYDRVSWHALDLSDPGTGPALSELMDGVDAVVHLVWAFQPTREPDYLHQVGVGGSSLVLAAAHRAGVPHLVHLSSVGAYAPRIDDRPVDESYPHTGMPSSLYSVHKAEFEARLDSFERDNPDGPTITRLRPGIVLQYAAGAALSRYGLPAYLPARMLRSLPVLPLDRAFAVPVVHADDLADALVRVLARRLPGAFNIATEQPLTRADIAAVLRARAVHVPAPVLRAATAASWRLHAQPLSPGWIDLAFAVAQLDSTRARTELGWTPARSPRAALSAAVQGMIDNAGTASPALRPRSAIERLRTLAGSGPISRRRRP